MPGSSYTSSPSKRSARKNSNRIYSPEEGTKDFEIESKLDLVDVRGWLGEKCKELCPNSNIYEVEKLTPIDTSSHDFYGFINENGEVYHAFTVMHHGFGSTIKVKKGIERIVRNEITILKRKEDHIKDTNDNKLIDFIVQSSEEARRKNINLKKIGSLTKSRVNLGLFSKISGRLFLITPSVCVAEKIDRENYCQLHQVEIEYGGKCEYLGAKIDMYEEIANLTISVNDILYNIFAQKGNPTSLTKFEWIARTMGFKTIDG